MDTSSRTSNRKRKRAASDAVINPFSHSPSTLRQFARAGYPTDLPLPSRVYPGFPHRPPRSAGKRSSSSSSSSPTASASAGADDADDEIATASSATGASTDGDGAAAAAGEQKTRRPRRGPNGGRVVRVVRRRRRRRGRGVDGKAHAYRARVGLVAAVARRSLAEGDVGTAARAFGLLARARVYGRPVDLRHERLWELGAEILMREGEGEGPAVVSRAGEVKRWGREEEEKKRKKKEEEEQLGEVDDDGDDERQEARLARLKTYFEYLIQQYPYSKQHAGSADSALDFHVALFSAEMEAAYAAHRRGLERLQRGRGGKKKMKKKKDTKRRASTRWTSTGTASWKGKKKKEEEEEDKEGDLSPPDHLRGLSRRERRLREREDGLRLAARRRMTELAERMDTVMETMPFSRDPELLRLRAMAALYVADLSVPPAPRSRSEDRRGGKARAEQRARAKGFLRRIKEAGGELRDYDERLIESLESDYEEEGESESEDGEDAEPVLPMFSSMGT